MMRSLDYGKNIFLKCLVCEFSESHFNLTTVIVFAFISLEANDASTSRSVKDLPPSISTLLECPNPPSKPPCPKYPRFGLFSEDEIPITISAKDYAWLLARSLSRIHSVSDTEEEESLQSKVPVWSAFNSLIDEEMPVTRVGTPPLVAAPAHEWSTLPTVLMQAQGINTQVNYLAPIFVFEDLVNWYEYRCTCKSCSCKSCFDR